MRKKILGKGEGLKKWGLTKDDERRIISGGSSGWGFSSGKRASRGNTFAPISSTPGGTIGKVKYIIKLGERGNNVTVEQGYLVSWGTTLETK